MSDSLPVTEVLPELRAALRDGGAAVLQAPPGAGKTTRVPLALLDEPWLGGGRIVLLEPRRLAARAAARHMARLRGEQVGATVGYRMRLETRVGPATRIEVVTEGVLTRMLQSDPALEGVGLVIFDEFHERSLHADLGLALTLQARTLLRPDLRLLVMSATLHGEPVAALLGGAPVITSTGRAYPVRVHYQPRAVEGRLEPAASRAVRQAVAENDGDVLVFLPGAAEIHRVEALLRDPPVPARVLPLYGNLPQAAQDAAIAPSAPGQRKVVLATSIAETSLTIEGVRVVVDSGWMRVPRFSPRTGMTRLETLTVSRASAEQRCGRAGRLGPGACYRMWTEPAQAALVPFGTPEILEADLAPLALELAAWGVADPRELAWLDPPPAAAFAQARELLVALGALDDAGAITAHGRAVAELPLHPRLAHLLLRGRELGCGGLAAEVAALLADRDVFRRGEVAPPADLRQRVHALRELARGRRTPAGVDAGGLRRALEESRLLRRRLRLDDGDASGEDGTGLLLAFAYPDRIAQARPGQPGRFRLRNGRGAALDPSDPLAREPFLAVADVAGQGRDSRIYLAAPLTAAELERHFAGEMAGDERVGWDAGARAVRAMRRERLGALVLREAPLPSPPPGQVTAALLEGIRALGLEALPWTQPSRQLRARIAFLHALDDDWPDVSEAALLATLPEWLGPFVAGMTRVEELQRVELVDALLARVGWERRGQLDALAPSHLTVPSGSRIPIDYADPAAPVLAVRLQEVFGLTETPAIAGGRVPLTLHLLSPARRPVQVTRDLASFWRTGYFDVRKDLRGRYPRHYWPDDPLQATPTHRVRPRE